MNLPPGFFHQNPTPTLGHSLTERYSLDHILGALLPLLCLTHVMSLLQDEAVVGMEIETLIATDRDQGSGGTVEFLLEEPVSYIPSLASTGGCVEWSRPLQVHGPFAIGLQTGVITLQRSLDYDEADTYDIRVIVQVAKST